MRKHPTKPSSRFPALLRLHSLSLNLFYNKLGLSFVSPPDFRLVGGRERMQQWRPKNPPAMTFDEVSIERSKSFVKALQELKNLRPQLYSAAEYCEKSYLHNEQKQMVLDNLKDYTVRALVNGVDHLGTVAYKLTDLLEQQTLDISTIELKISCMNQQILTCQTYTEKEVLRKYQMSVTTLRHHKHYILPDFVSKTFQNNLQQQRDATTENHIQAKPCPYPSGTSASKTLSCLLASENNSAPYGTGSASSSIGDYSKDSKMSSEVFHLMDTEETAAPLPLSTHRHSISNTLPNTFGVMDTVELSKSLSAFRSFDNPGRHKIFQPPVRSKSMLSMFFAKNKAMKPRKAYA